MQYNELWFERLLSPREVNYLKRTALANREEDDEEFFDLLDLFESPEEAEPEISKKKITKKQAIIMISALGILLIGLIAFQIIRSNDGLFDSNDIYIEGEEYTGEALSELTGEEGAISDVAENGSEELSTEDELADIEAYLASLSSVGEPTYLGNGTYTTADIKPGYYEVTTTALAGMSIISQNGELVTNEHFGNGKNCSDKYMALIREGDQIEIKGLEGNLDSVIFTVAERTYRMDLVPGVFIVGMDVFEGNYHVQATEGYGCITVTSKNGVIKESIIIGSEEGQDYPTGFDINLSNGDAINVMMIKSISLTLI